MVGLAKLGFEFVLVVFAVGEVEKVTTAMKLLVLLIMALKVPLSEKKLPLLKGLPFLLDAPA